MYKRGYAMPPSDWVQAWNNTKMRPRVKRTTSALQESPLARMGPTAPIHSQSSNHGRKGNDET
uniref:Uncharacterized protein n=1 Tax=Picea glauca TaxID=3330 RepID=A0A117NFS4_PICGL|nr:hypothetical protein ABT39_MTgene2494 [Picea glauca]KUM45663.1 hypothetical protein ABT39_MTgene2499 [Picea glauca]KUM45684.1 hypothetical protein ABT39_MTgene2520 [Picea glauca]